MLAEDFHIPYSNLLVHERELWFAFDSSAEKAALIKDHHPNVEVVGLTQENLLAITERTTCLGFFDFDPTLAARIPKSVSTIYYYDDPGDQIAVLPDHIVEVGFFQTPSAVTLSNLRCSTVIFKSLPSPEVLQALSPQTFYVKFACPVSAAIIAYLPEHIRGIFLTVDPEDDALLQINNRAISIYFLYMPKPATVASLTRVGTIPRFLYSSAALMRVLPPNVNAIWLFEPSLETVCNLGDHVIDVRLFGTVHPDVVANITRATKLWFSDPRVEYLRAVQPNIYFVGLYKSLEPAEMCWFPKRATLGFLKPDPIAIYSMQKFMRTLHLVYSSPEAIKALEVWHNLQHVFFYAAVQPATLQALETARFVRKVTFVEAPSVESIQVLQGNVGSVEFIDPVSPDVLAALSWQIKEVYHRVRLAPHILRALPQSIACWVFAEMPEPEDLLALPDMTSSFKIKQYPKFEFMLHRPSHAPNVQFEGPLAAILPYVSFIRDSSENLVKIYADCFTEAFEFLNPDENGIKFCYAPSVEMIRNLSRNFFLVIFTREITPDIVRALGTNFTNVAFSFNPSAAVIDALGPEVVEVRFNLDPELETLRALRLTVKTVTLDDQYSSATLQNMPGHIEIVKVNRITPAIGDLARTIVRIRLYAPQPPEALDLLPEHLEDLIFPSNLSDADLRVLRLYFDAKAIRPNIFVGQNKILNARNAAMAAAPPSPPPPLPSPPPPPSLPPEGERPMKRPRTQSLVI